MNSKNNNPNPSDPPNDLKSRKTKSIGGQQNSPIFSAMNKKLPKSIGRYLIEKELGVGATSRVFLGRDPNTKEEVAIKVFPLDFRCGPVALLKRRLYLEVKNARKLNHPNIIRIYEYGDDDAGLYIAMKYAEKGDLAGLLEEKGKLALLEAITVIKSIASALLEAENHHIVHRDIKPQNILITKSGDFKLADLGISKNLDQDNGLSRTDSSKGTPYYMPPEQFLCAKRVAHHADIYALGVTFYQIVTGKLPFPGDNQYEVLEKKKSGEFTPPHEINPAVNTHLSKIICKMMALKPEDRFQSAREVLDALEGYGSGSLDQLVRCQLETPTTDTEKRHQVSIDVPIPQPSHSHTIPPKKPMISPKSDVTESSQATFKAPEKQSTNTKAISHKKPINPKYVISLISFCGIVIAIALFFGFNNHLDSLLRENHRMTFEMTENLAERVRRFFSSLPINETHSFASKKESLKSELNIADQFLEQNQIEKATAKYLLIWKSIRQLQHNYLINEKCHQLIKKIAGISNQAHSISPDLSYRAEWKQAESLEERARSLLKQEKYLQAHEEYGRALTIYEDLYTDFLQTQISHFQEKIGKLRSDAMTINAQKIDPMSWEAAEALLDHLVKIPVTENINFDTYQKWQKAHSQYIKVYDNARAINNDKAEQLKTKTSKFGQNIPFAKGDILVPPKPNSELGEHTPVKNRSDTNSKEGGDGGGIKSLETITADDPLESTPDPNTDLPENEPQERDVDFELIGKDFLKTIDLDLWVNENKETFIAGELFSLTVRPKIDCHLAIFSHYPDGKSILLYPNIYQNDTFISANQSIRIPDSVKLNNKSGFKIEVCEPFGREIIEVIACTDKSTLNFLLEGKNAVLNSPFASVNRERIKRRARRGLKIISNASADHAIQWGIASLTIHTSPQ